MSKNVIVATMACALLLVVGLATVGAKPVDRGEILVPEGGGTMDVAFDGFCDGMSVTATGSQAVDGVRCGCATEPVFGSIGGGLHVSPDAGTGVGWAHFAIRPDGTFQIWDSLGLLLEGTWSAGCPAGSGGDRSSTLELF